jgi:hypothetical protein
MKIKEVATINPIKPLTPQQQRIKTLQTQKDNLGKQIKVERDRQKITKAQQQLTKAIQSKSN